MAPLAGVDPAALKSLAAELAAANAHSVVVAGGSASGGAHGAAIELAALVLNVTLGAFDGGLLDEASALPADAGSGGAALATLAEEMRTGKVDVLVVSGANPVYDAPAGVAFADAMAKVGTRSCRSTTGSTRPAVSPTCWPR
ncbi:MAG: hypothetical protein U0P30_13225 [Vicinamibacterales bacterium]